MNAEAVARTRYSIRYRPRCTALLTILTPVPRTRNDPRTPSTHSCKEGRPVPHHGMKPALVKVGLAWWYRQYAPHDDTLRMLEDKARKDRLGLWADPHPVPPWCWRKQKKGRQC